MGRLEILFDSGERLQLGDGFDRSSGTTDFVLELIKRAHQGKAGTVYLDDEKLFGFAAYTPAPGFIATPIAGPVEAPVNVYPIQPPANRPIWDDGSLGGPVIPVQPVIGPGILAVTGLGALLPMIPDSWRKALLGAVAGLGIARGAVISKVALLAALRSVPVVGFALAAAVSLIVADSILVDVDIPFVPSFGGIDIPFIGGGGSPGDWAVAQHGPVVKEWSANGTPFVMFQDGFMAARRKTGVWHFWKPKKPIVYVPGSAMSARQAGKLATVYAREKKRAKKMYGLVDSRQGKSSPAPKTVIVNESGPGSVRV